MSGANVGIFWGSDGCFHDDDDDECVESDLSWYTIDELFIAARTTDPCFATDKSTEMGASLAFRYMLVLLLCRHLSSIRKAAVAVKIAMSALIGFNWFEPICLLLYQYRRHINTIAIVVPAFILCRLTYCSWEASLLIIPFGWISSPSSSFKLNVLRGIPSRAPTTDAKTYVALYSIYLVDLLDEDTFSIVVAELVLVVLSLWLLYHNGIDLTCFGC